MPAKVNCKYVLRYFDRIGVAEGSKLLLTAADVEWKEEHPVWPQEKHKQPFGRMPVLVESHSDGSPDFVICESGSIERFLARTYGFIPNDIHQAAIQEQLRDQASDMFAAFISQLVAKSEEDHKENFAKFEGLLTKLVEVQTKQLRENGTNGYLFGNRLTYADIITYAFYKIILVGMVKRQANIVDVVRPRLTAEIVKLISTIESDSLLASYMSRSDSLAAVVRPPAKF